MSENILWSTKSWSLKTFVHSYTLPQLVKIEEGFCSKNNEETLSTGEILMLHVHSVPKLLVEDADYRQYFVPRNCQCKVEILPRICQDRYRSVEDVVEAWTCADFKFIRVVKVHWHPPSLHIKAGDILELKRTVVQNHIKFLECLFYGETGYLVKLPLNVKAVFEPLARNESYPFQEVIHSFKFPVRVKFKSNCKTKDADNRQSRGSVLLKNIRQESKVIATSRDDDMNPVVLIPTDLDVNVFPARGALLGDKEYARFCKAIHDSTELLSKVNLFENASRLCECFEDPAEEALENNEVASIPSQTTEDTHRLLTEPKPTTSKEATSLTGLLIRGGENPSNTSNEQPPSYLPRVESLQRSKPPVAPKPPNKASQSSARLSQSPHQSIRGELLTTSNENLSNSIDEQAPPLPTRVQSLLHSNATGADKYEKPSYLPRVESLQRSKPPVAPKPPNKASQSSARLSQSPHQSIRGELLTTSNENLSNSIDEQAPPLPTRVQSLLHSNATGADKDDDNHHYDEISSTERNSNLVRSLERYHMDNDSERVHKRQKDKLGKSKSSERNSLPTVIPKLPSERSQLITPLSEASSTQQGPMPKQSIFSTQSLITSCLEHSQGHPAENVYIESAPRPSILSNSPSKCSVFSEDLKDLSVTGVVECLGNLYMGQYAELFQRNLIDGNLLMELDSESLSHLGVRNPLHQKKLLKFINGWRPNTN